MYRIAIFLLFLLPLAACTTQRETRTLETMLPASGVGTLMTHANIGSVTVKASTDAKVHASVKLLPSNNFFWNLFTHSKAPEAIRGATLGYSLDKSTLDFNVQYPADTDSERVNEEWAIAIPASVHIEDHINIGRLEVSGIAGGVEAQMNIGKVTLDVPGGPLDIVINVGKINAQTRTLDYGDIVLAANVGNTRLSVDGLSVGGLQNEGAGSQMRYKGKGSNTIRLKVNTGKVTLALTDAAKVQPATIKK
ncbi:MAG TPA: hypothetical protein VFX47_00025 [Gammaproteobacteria bacterium]|nr:hypothetical protein [Gammaproteobacteria bacterium]